MITKEPVFYIGVDLGQARDPTAIAIVRLDGADYQVGHLERLPLGTPYPAVIGNVRRLIDRLPGKACLVIDATGVGRPVADLFKAAGIDFTGVIITGGLDTSWSRNYASVPKIQLISKLQALLHMGNLKILRDLPEARPWSASCRIFALSTPKTER
jgi:hypothetical protein